MKLLVTGGLGFIGSNFIIHVLKNYNDFEIINLDAEIDGSNHDNLKDLEKSNRYRFVKGNITNRKLLDEIIPDVDCVINFAAESHVDRSIANPMEYYTKSQNRDLLFTEHLTTLTANDETYIKLGATKVLKEFIMLSKSTRPSSKLFSWLT